MSKILIGVLGPSTGGKSSLVDGFCAIHTNAAKVSFAEYLKEEAARRGWNGEKDAVGRKFLQNLSEELKREHGESIFYDIGIMKALQSPAEIVLFDDMRFFVEIVAHMNYKGDVFTSYIVTVYEPQAEARWENAVVDPSPDCDWARHSSECEWRTVRHLFPSIINDKSLGLEIGVNRFDNFIQTTIA